ncbi:dubious [Schizosaccharomyces pombe]|uniref:Putative uncharacterized protein P8B7.32 n=1 Tax=Schizosaccharomyces pombe (strain 972 / ATCC 24843) TaxID=284812 RepID=YORW_SCHPO|nr:uncharacterized protein SPBP8B7.32 [Schizosaccharomyces pombe]G2TRR5.1 RecName: Full=Putative uncharacterized protein P8B7.32 [Schizosaccharomyces pombe 972h-]CCD31382.1 dubious [Schizosaccharomyces pombe]|eukprot:NP_001343172.1 uncharacterized protein SPBP8B7.32 [Schizosaccharomyces pombe]
MESNFLLFIVQQNLFDHYIISIVSNRIIGIRASTRKVEYQFFLAFKSFPSIMGRTSPKFHIINKHFLSLFKREK